MPSRGYRKGRSDRKVPRPALLRTRTSARTHRQLAAEADARSMTLSALIAAVLDAHARQTRATLPQPNGPAAAALRDLARIGNNLNQIARQANLMRLDHLADRARACLDAVNRAVDRL